MSGDQGEVHCECFNEKAFKKQRSRFLQQVQLIFVCYKHGETDKRKLSTNNEKMRQKNLQTDKKYEKQTAQTYRRRDLQV